MLSREEYNRRRANGESAEFLLYEAMLEKLGLSQQPTEQNPADGWGLYANRYFAREDAAQAMRSSLSNFDLRGAWSAGRDYLSSYRPNEWEGRQEAIDEYRRTRDEALLNRIRGADIAAGNGLRMYSAKDRARMVADAWTDEAYAQYYSALAKAAKLFGADEASERYGQRANNADYSANTGYQWATNGYGFGGKPPVVKLERDRMNHYSGKY